MKKPRPAPDQAHVLAVRHPPKGEVPQRRLKARSPYVTNVDMARHLGLGEVFGDGPLPIPLEAMSPDDIAQLALHGLGIAHNLDAAAQDAPQAVKIAAAIMLNMATQSLNEGAYAGVKNNPLLAMEVFLVFHHMGLYPPLWVLDWLAQGFGRYFQQQNKNNGTADIAAALGLNRGPGQRPPRKEMAALTLEDHMMQEIGGLTLLGLSISDAAHMVAERLRDAGRDAPEAETLSERFSKRGWNKLFKPLRGLCKNIDADQRKAALAAYPPHSIPNRFK